MQIRSLNDIADLRVGVIRGFSYSAEFDAAEFFTRDGARTLESNFSKLIRKRIDLVLADRYAADEIFRSRPELADQIRQIDPPYLVRPIYVAFSKADRAHVVASEKCPCVLRNRAWMVCICEVVDHKADAISSSRADRAERAALAASNRNSPS